MVLKKLTHGGLIGVFLGWARRLRFPVLFLLAATLFLLDLFIPDVLPLADELLLGLVALLLANWKNKPPEEVSKS
jgi:hypothetical protein